MSKALGIAFVFLLLTGAVSPQNRQMPQPAPELKKLDYFVGTWKTEAVMNTGSSGASSPFTATDHSEWMEGGFFAVNHSDFQTSFGKGVELDVMGYDPVKNVYFYNSFTSSGRAEYATGTVQGDTWIWSSEQNSGGHTVKSRFTQQILSPASYSIKLEISQDGGNWVTYMQGKATRQ